MWSVLPTFVIGAVGAYISRLQWRIAEIRLRHDTYERKFKVYEAAKTLLVVFQFNAKITHDEYFSYLRGVTDAEFVFDDPEVPRYLQTLREQAIELIRTQTAGLSDENAKISQWFLSQFDVLRSKFYPSMRLHPPSLREYVGPCGNRLLTSLGLGWSKPLRYPSSDPQR
jgi:hypothetical protein